jgi:hypothetical protein
MEVDEEETSQIAISINALLASVKIELGKENESVVRCEDNLLCKPVNETNLKESSFSVSMIH